MRGGSGSWRGFVTLLLLILPSPAAKAGGAAPFSLAPTFHAAWWFYPAAIALALALLTRGHRWQIQQARKREGALALRVGRGASELQAAEAEVRKAQEVAHAANRASSDFATHLSREVHAYLNGVLVMSELLLGTHLTLEQTEYVGTVKTSTDSLLTRFHEILDFSKLEVGKLDLEAIDFKLRGSLEPALETMALRAQQKGLDLTCSVELDVPEALIGDPGRLRQVLLNLLGNSLKFTEKGGVRLRVQQDTADETCTCLHFSVQDTGSGVPLEKQQRIFEAPTQDDGSTPPRLGGAGLGLTISRHLVRMMGGRIWVESVPGQGSTFHFTARFGVSQMRSSPAPVEKAQLEGMRVLVVDDNLTNRSVLEGLLTSWGMQPMLAGSGFAALRALERALTVPGPLPLVLCDANLPGMDGFALAEQIRKTPGLAAAPIMMLSAAGQRGDAARCRELGLAAYLTKPLAQKELQEAIARAVRPKPPEAKPALVTRHSLREEAKSLRILLAEANQVNQKLATRLLEQHGHSVVLAGNGREALGRLEKEPFDLVLMDVQMPEVDGLEATVAIRKKEKTTGTHIPIVAMTAPAVQGYAERCLEAGVDGYISKPINVRELFTVVDAVLP
ncbi:MAG: response regulator [Terriglobia bacterium]|jgi:CheY-like chemotaxis protein/nitrogen-specific signal transduction histidine kinase